MKHSELKSFKKLRGVYKQCIESLKLTKNVKSLRNSLEINIKSITSHINGTHYSKVK